ncbi:prolyl oligopeptidase family serine peptidase [Botrimarina hoheduenensis]|uniref:prolyl oligopeptidase n=1 Tax=Botrimarina hoheduenensis TaxID=2528000 RepID=A0A5C5W9T0_9BACT|nr:prolyl oligopeptidase family serine peptidase [Botrimarina hoheduenensis]TWT46781.1 Prolyl endopeptidase [Botrimarina hoheduenensis]
MIRQLGFLFAWSVLIVPMIDAAPHAYPETNREATVDTYAGPEGRKIEVADPYRWLEEDVRESDRVASWVARQQAFTEAYLTKLPERAAFRERLTALWDYERRSPPERVGKPDESPRRYTYRRNDGLQNQSVVFLTDDPGQDGRVLIDPNTWSDDGAVALAGYTASHDGQLLVYLRSEAGSDWKTARVMRIDSGEELSDEVRWIKYGGVQWAANGSGFYYTRYPEPAEGQAFQASSLNPAVYFHKLGTPQSQDVLLYNDPDHPDWGSYLVASQNGRWLLLLISRGTDNQNRLYVRRADQPLAVEGDPRDAWTRLADDFDNEWSPITCLGDRLYLSTDYQAPRRRLVTIDLEGPHSGPLRERLMEVIPQRSAPLEWVSFVGARLFAGYLEDVAGVVRLHTVGGEALGEIPLPGVGSVGGFSGWQNSTETYYTYTSYDAPPTIYRYEIATGESTLQFSPQTGVDLSGYTVRREFYTSKDGTRVPIFLMHKKDLVLDGQNPTLLYGYGGFTISLTPGYSPSRLAWVEKGGVLAVANLRGGGEYGEPWHEAGKLGNKQTVFDDFIAAAEWLCAQRITQPRQIAIQGGSNGGLLVGAVMTQRPDLFGACLPAVGVMDMLRFDQFTAGQFWRDEYGSSSDPAMVDFLLGYSPYHNVRSGVTYPATLVMTADTDDRVVPMHSFKFAAALQHAQTTSSAGDEPLLIRIETRAGHGAGKPTSKLIEEAADVWAFAWEHTARQKSEPAR